MMEKTIEVVKHIPQEHVQNHTVEQIIDMPVMMQRQVRKAVEVPQIQFIDKAVDVPVVVQRQVPIVQKVQRISHCRCGRFPDCICSRFQCTLIWFGCSKRLLVSHEHGLLGCVAIVSIIWKLFCHVCRRISSTLSQWCHLHRKQPRHRFQS